jgi:hypothetical protein
MQDMASPHPFCRLAVRAQRPSKLQRLLSRHAAPLSSLPADLRGDVTLGERGRVLLDEELGPTMCRRTLEVVAPLRDAGKLSSFLLQLTPAFKPAQHGLDELEPLLRALAPVPVAIELRRSPRSAGSARWEPPLSASSSTTSPRRCHRC